VHGSELLEDRLEYHYQEDQTTSYHQHIEGNSVVPKAPFPDQRSCRQCEARKNGGSNSELSPESIVGAFGHLHEWTQNVDRSKHQKKEGKGFGEIHAS
jgi:hypothetical protein